MTSIEDRFGNVQKMVDTWHADMVRLRLHVVSDDGECLTCKHHAFRLRDEAKKQAAAPPPTQEPAPCQEANPIQLSLME
jgi:hypothetical protein